VAVVAMQSEGEIAGSVLGIEVREVHGGPSDFADLPGLRELACQQNVEAVIRGGELRGIHVGQIARIPFRAAEVCSLSCQLNVGSCTDGTIGGIHIDNLSGSHGVRARLQLNVGRLERARLTGITATAPADVLQPSAPA